MRTFFVFVVLLALGGGGVAYYATTAGKEAATTFRTATVSRGDLVSTIGATGTMQPEDVIDVGSQVTGKIQSFGQDPKDPTKQIDYGTHVEEGTVLAKIDPTLYQAKYDEALAALIRAKADLTQLEAKCNQTEQEWRRAKSLLPTKAIADTDYDLAEANYLSAKATVEVGKATILQAQAALAMAKTNLDYTTIKSPVKGVIIDRRVNVGQTVVAAMNAASLALLAKDLRRMQIWVPVNETDIGRIRPGLPVQFTVDTYPDEVFEGKVLQIRLNAQFSQNVVTYIVVVQTDNPPHKDYPNGKLLPYMTANVKFEIERRPKVLLVPNGALRWKPRDEQIALDFREASKGESAAASMSGSTRKRPLANKAGEEPQKLWVVSEEGLVRPIEVRVGTSDGIQTEISGDGLQEGMEVVIGEMVAQVADSSEPTTNPFLPKIRPPWSKPQRPKQ